MTEYCTALYYRRTHSFHWAMALARNVEVGEGIHRVDRVADGSGADIVAFVILTWNSSAYIQACLDSVFNLTSISSEIWVVDNGSTDGTSRMVRAASTVRPGIHFIPLEENKGTTVSRNIALRSLGSHVDFVCVLDSDTVVNDDAIRSMLDVLRTHPDVGIVGPRMVNAEGVEQLTGRNLPTLKIKLLKASPSVASRERGAKLEVPESRFSAGLKDVGYLISACWMLPCSTLDSVGLFDENIFYAPEDVDYCVRAHKAGLRVVVCEDATITHHYQRVSHQKIVSSTNMRHVSGLCHYFRKHGYLLDSSRAYRAGQHGSASQETLDPGGHDGRQ